MFMRAHTSMNAVSMLLLPYVKLLRPAWLELA